MRFAAALLMAASFGVMSVAVAQVPAVLLAGAPTPRACPLRVFSRDTLSRREIAPLRDAPQMLPRRSMMTAVSLSWRLVAHSVAPAVAGAAGWVRPRADCAASQPA